MGTVLFCMTLLPVLKRTREEFEPKGVEAFTYLDDVSIGMVEVTSDTVDIAPFLQRVERNNSRGYCYTCQTSSQPT